MAYEWAPDYSSFIDRSKYADATWKEGREASGWDEGQKAGWYTPQTQDVWGSGGNQLIDDPWGGGNPYETLKSAGMWDLSNKDSNTWKYLQKNASSLKSPELAMGSAFANTVGGGMTNDIGGRYQDAFTAGGYKGNMTGQSAHDAMKYEQYLRNKESHGGLAGALDMGKDIVTNPVILSALTAGALAPAAAGGMGLGGLLGGAAGSGLGAQLSSFFGGGLAGAAGTGAVVGGAKGLLTGDVVGGALQGGLGGAGGYGVGQAIGGAPETGSGVDWSTATAQNNSGSMLDSPFVSESGSFDPTGSEIGPGSLASESGIPMGSQAPSWFTEGGADFASREAALAQAADTNPMANPITMESTMSTSPFYDLSSFSTAPVEETNEPVDGSFDAGMGDYLGLGNPADTGAVMNSTQDASLMDKLRDAYSKMKDPLAMAGAMGKMYMSQQQSDMLKKELASQKASQFDNREFDQMARDWQDPAKRSAMVRSAPGYQAAEDYLMREQQRKLAQKGNFSQLGQGGAISNNWAVPMGDVAAKNAMNFEQALFGQIRDLTGMTQNHSPANAALAGGFLPKAAQMEDSGWKDLYEALRRNQGFLPDVLKTQLA